MQKQQHEPPPHLCPVCLNEVRAAMFDEHLDQHLRQAIEHERQAMRATADDADAYVRALARDRANRSYEGPRWRYMLDRRVQAIPHGWIIGSYEPLAEGVATVDYPRQLSREECAEYGLTPLRRVI